jgi:hypothetical protein
VAGREASANVLPGGSQNKDTVTLAGRTAESQETGTGNGNAQFAESAAFFYAEKGTFRAANGSASTPAQTKNVPDLPVKISNEGANATQNGAVDVPAAGASAPTQAPDATGNVSAEIGAGSASATSGSSQTPIAELAQLDDTLQQMGINPQSITLFNRMAMLLYANDPAALRVLMQTLQTGTQQLSGSSNGTATSGNNSAASPVTGSNVLQLLTTQAQLGSVSLQSPGGSEDGASTALADKSPTAGAGTLPISVNLSPSDARNTSQVTLQAPQMNSFSTQLEDLQITFAAVGGDQLSPGSQSSSAGQMLNVTA